METMIQDYFNRINYRSNPLPDLKTLEELHRCHTLAIPFENFDAFTENEVKIDLESLFDKIVLKKRGGYCFEQNLLFFEVLKHLGFKVSLIGARVLIGREKDVVPQQTHIMSLIEIDNVQYLSDVGFGSNTPEAPFRFVLDNEQQALHDHLRISALDDDFVLEKKILGNWKRLNRFNLNRVYYSDCEVANFFVYAHPTSKFRNNLMVSRILPEGRITLDNLEFSFYPYDGEIIKKTIDSEEELEKFLTKDFEFPDEVITKKLLEKLGLLN